MGLDRTDQAKPVHDFIADEAGIVAAYLGMMLVVVSGAVLHVGSQRRRQILGLVARNQVDHVIGNQCRKPAHPLPGQRQIIGHPHRGRRHDLNRLWIAARFLGALPDESQAPGNQVGISKLQDHAISDSPCQAQNFWPAVNSRKVTTARSNSAGVTGFLPNTRRELSPRPMPSSMRPPEIRLRVANRLAVTVRSRTAGLVTHGPSRILRVAFAIRVSSGYGSFQSTWESKIQPYSNPAASACWVRATIRSTEISGLRVIPNFMLFSFAALRKTRPSVCRIEYITLLPALAGLSQHRGLANGVRHHHYRRHRGHGCGHLSGRCCD